MNLIELIKNITVKIEEVDISKEQLKKIGIIIGSIFGIIAFIFTVIEFITIEDAPFFLSYIIGNIIDKFLQLTLLVSFVGIILCIYQILYSFVDIRFPKLELRLKAVKNIILIILCNTLILFIVDTLKLFSSSYDLTVTFSTFMCRFIAKCAIGISLLIIYLKLKAKEVLDKKDYLIIAIFITFGILLYILQCAIYSTAIVS